MVREMIGNREKRMWRTEREKEGMVRGKEKAGWWRQKNEVKGREDRSCILSSLETTYIVPQPAYPIRVGFCPKPQ